VDAKIWTGIPSFRDSLDVIGHEHFVPRRIARVEAQYGLEVAHGFFFEPCPIRLSGRSVPSAQWNETPEQSQKLTPHRTSSQRRRSAAESAWASG